MNEIDLKYYKKFPPALQNALINKGLKFPDGLEREYEDITVYRGVKYTKNKKDIEKSDFLSNVERKLLNPSVVADENDIEYYSCSVYENIDFMKNNAKYPRKNMAISKGTIKSCFGPIVRNNNTTHIHLFLFKDIDLSSDFKVVEK